MTVIEDRALKSVQKIEAVLAPDSDGRVYPSDTVMLRSNGVEVTAGDLKELCQELRVRTR